TTSARNTDQSFSLKRPGSARTPKRSSPRLPATTSFGIRSSPKSPARPRSILPRLTIRIISSTTAGSRIAPTSSRRKSRSSARRLRSGSSARTTLARADLRPGASRKPAAGGEEYANGPQHRRKTDRSSHRAEHQRHGDGHRVDKRHAHAGGLAHASWRRVAVQQRHHHRLARA